MCFEQLKFKMVLQSWRRKGGYSVSILALNEDRMQNYPYPNFRNNLLRMCVKLLIFS